MHEEPGVQGKHPPVGRGDVMRVRVAAQAVVRLIEGDVVGLLEHVGGGQAGHSGADDGGLRPGRVPRGFPGHRLVLVVIMMLVPPA